LFREKGEGRREKGEGDEGNVGFERRWNYE